MRESVVPAKSDSKPRIVTISRSRRDEWQALLRRAFSTRWDRLYLRPGFFPDYITHDPGFRPGHLVGLMVADRLVSVYQVFARRIVIGQRTYRAEGIGNVGTDVEFQGRGYGTRLLRAYLRHNSNRDVAFVYARDGAFYRRIGWRRLKSRTLIVLRDSVRHARRGRTIRRRRITAEDLPALARIYARFNSAEGLSHMVRSDAYWRRWIWGWKLGIYRLRAEVVTDLAQRPLGYIFSRLSGSTLLIEEYGALPSRRDEVHAEILSAFRGQRGATTLQVMRSVGSLERFLDRERLEYQTTRGFHETGQAFIFHPELKRFKEEIGLWHVDHF